MFVEPVILEVPKIGTCAKFLNILSYLFKKIILIPFLYYKDILRYTNISEK